MSRPPKSQPQEPPSNTNYQRHSNHREHLLPKNQAKHQGIQNTNHTEETTITESYRNKTTAANKTTVTKPDPTPSYKISTTKTPPRTANTDCRRNPNLNKQTLTFRRGGGTRKVQTRANNDRHRKKNGDGSSPERKDGNTVVRSDELVAPPSRVITL
ncbi:hypothetical protein P8452_22657 [Trifolium repens]|nr:hypothetical protein P8452_22657 [Trifolium repens]